MARLWINSNGQQTQAFDLKLGVNRLGRHPHCDFQINDPSVSSLHCEIILGDGALRIRDCNSTNGIYLNGAPVTEASLQAGQQVRLGEVTLLVENTEVTVAIPRFETAEVRPASVKLSDGTSSCHNHPERHAIGKCTKCGKVFCNSCLRDLRLVRGRHHKLCPVCSGECVPLKTLSRKRKPLVKRLQDTLKLKFPFKRRQ